MRWTLGIAVAAAGCATILGSSGGWSTARLVPGTTIAAIQPGGEPYGGPPYVATSCSSPQDCTVAYIAVGKGAPVLSLTRHNGRWGPPRRVPGLPGAQVTGLELACGPAGDCLLATGVATGNGNNEQIKVARLARGRWSKAAPVPGAAALHPGDSSRYPQLACGATGWCAVSGQSEKPAQYTGGQPFVASEHNGTWTRAQAVPGLDALSQGWAAGVDVISCDARATCTAAGDYRDHAVRHDEPYAVTDQAGRLGKAQPITGSASLGDSYIDALSCSQPGDCSAAGTEGDNDTGTPVGMFTVTETGGTWQPASRLRGTIPLENSVDTESISAMTCTAPGRCTAVGVYATDADSEDSVPVQAVPFEAVQTRGTWSAIHVIRGLPRHAVAWLTSVSCASAGNCAAGGYWLSNPTGAAYNMSNNHAFLVTETRGTWGLAPRHVPGLKALHSGDSDVDVVSCRPRRGCTAIGDFAVTRTRRLVTTSHR
jgi:hypothetical protein